MDLFEAVEAEVAARKRREAQRWRDLSQVRSVWYAAAAGAVGGNEASSGGDALVDGMVGVGAESTGVLGDTAVDSDTLRVRLVYETEVTVYRHRLRDARSAGIVVNLRRSGFIHERSPFDDDFSRHIAAASGYVVLDLEYPLAPVMPFPAALNCCYWFLDVVRAHPEVVGGDPSMPVVVLGHEAGGNLAVGAQVLLHRAGKPGADCLLLDCPLLDLDTPDSARALEIEAYRRKVPVGDDLVSPVLLGPADLADFPQVVVHMDVSDGASQPAASAGEIFVRKVTDAGGKARGERYRGAADDVVDGAVDDTVQTTESTRAAEPVPGAEARVKSGTSRDSFADFVAELGSVAERMKR